MEENKSEVARLMERIDLEMQAVRYAMSSMAAGYARHDFIHARMLAAGVCSNQLAAHIGEEEATRVLCQRYDAMMNMADKPSEKARTRENRAPLVAALFSTPLRATNPGDSR